jgi:proline iminopeptidase
MTDLARRSLVGVGLAAAASLAALRPGSAAADVTQRGAPDGSAAVRTGGARLIPINGGFNVWAKPIGAPSSGIPVLTLHGGPGFPHFYFECFEDFLPQAGISYWYYDQLGCGFSDQPTDSRLWTIGRFTEEVEQVRAALGLEKMVLLGHSWGGLLSIEYALKHPERLSGLVISNMCPSTASYIKYINVLRAALPAHTLHRLQELEQAKDYDSAEYERIIFEDLYRKHICRLNPWPEPVSRAVKWLSAPVYNTIQGKSEFEVTGVMKDWDRWSALSSITVPTLVLGGRYDTMDPKVLEEMGRRLKNGKTVICSNGSHLSMYDDQRAYFSALIPFLKLVTRASV